MDSSYATPVPTKAKLPQLAKPEPYFIQMFVGNYLALSSGYYCHIVLSFTCTSSY